MNPACFSDAVGPASNISSATRAADTDLGTVRLTASTREQEESFVARLEAKGIAVTVRDTRGREIDGACGQLAATTARR